MCTVSVVPLDDGFRIACNRDERRTRATAVPPQRHRVPGGASVWPVDPESGGTWIGVNDAGLAAVVLNRSPASHSLRRPTDDPAPSRPSRGTIVPALLREERLTDALESVRRLPIPELDPFTLLLLQGGGVAIVSAIAGRLFSNVAGLTRPLLLTSSSLGDHLVIAPRRTLFARLLARFTDPLRAQAALHRHRWSRRPEISVVMSRADAATVSRTVVDVTPGRIRMRYQALTV